MLPYSVVYPMLADNHTVPVMLFKITDYDSQISVPIFLAHARGLVFVNNVNGRQRYI